MRTFILLSSIFLSTFSFSQNEVLQAQNIERSQSSDDLLYFETYLAYNSEFYIRFAFYAKYIEGENKYTYRLAADKYNCSDNEYITGRYLCTWTFEQGSQSFNDIAFSNTPQRDITSAIVLSDGNIAVAGDDFLIIINSELKHLKDYGQTNHVYQTLHEDENKVLVAGYIYNENLIGTMLIDLQQETSEWNETSFEPYSVYSGQTFALKNNKVLKILSRYDSRYDDSDADGQRAQMYDRSTLSEIETEYDWGIALQEYSVNYQGVCAGNYYDVNDDSRSLTFIDVFKDETIKKIPLGDEEISEMKWMSDQMLHVYYNLGDKYFKKVYDQSGNLKNEFILSKKVILGDGNVSQSIDGTYEICSEIGSRNYVKALYIKNK